MTLLEKIAAATRAVELIGYREDAERLPAADRFTALVAIRKKLRALSFGRPVRARPALPPAKSIKGLFGKHHQVSAATDPDYGHPLSPCAYEQLPPRPIRPPKRP